MDYGLVSIITPSWNCGQYIEACVHSIQAQTYADWELLFQDDCSSDETKEIVSRLAETDPRIKYECNPKNSGAAITRNNALKRAKGEWIAFLDSDDLWEPTKLEKQLEFMSVNGYDFSYTCYQEIDKNGDCTGAFVSGPKQISKFGMYAYCWTGCLTVMYRKDAIGLLQVPHIAKNNDYAMWLKIARKADCYLLDECLAKYRRGRVGSISSNKYAVMIKWHYKLWRDAMNMSVLGSLFWTGMNLVCGFYKKLIFVKRV